ncbi:dihydroneopterin triphosphate diphosphatase [Hylemonella gracilis]|uniref:Dihydroneopterin triphosphate diphosphatase n=1 Tax=Hylemonella gracilis TaxID=80880 RepID=A0A4P6UEP8_9BURK|nr:dihydroneopterin triphosphate diphosphatase [Hylemonella gracilis]QBK03482.1 dihydroneopterin triphosphate diphosphatase [Hylemonella gracilis]
MVQFQNHGNKIPQSVLVLIHTPALEVLLIQRADTPADEPDYWQSVTGSKDHVDEPYATTAWREVHEETGIDARQLPQGLIDWELENVYEIYPWWRKRYAPGVTHNTEHLFSLCVPAGTSIRLAPREHRAYQWLPWREAAEVCASPSNAEACLLLPRFADLSGGPAAES